MNVWYMCLKHLCESPVGVTCCCAVSASYLSHLLGSPIAVLYLRSLLETYTRVVAFICLSHLLGSPIVVLCLHYLSESHTRVVFVTCLSYSYLLGSHIAVLCFHSLSEPRTRIVSFACLSYLLASPALMEYACYHLTNIYRSIFTCQSHILESPLETECKRDL